MCVLQTKNGLGIQPRKASYFASKKHNTTITTGFLDRKLKKQNWYQSQLKEKRKPTYTSTEDIMTRQNC